VFALVILIGSQAFFIRNPINQVLNGITLALAFGFGYLLVKSVKREVEQRERLEVLTKELATANDKLKDLDKLKSQFLSFASHDLKSPIALIKQFATLIYDGTYAEAAKVKETAFKIKMTADRAVTLVENFLDIRKIEEGKMEYVFEEKNIVEFVKGITSDFELLAKQKGLSVSFQTSSPEIKVKIDTSKMRQVIQNFLDNSLKYIEAGWIKVTITEEQSTVTIAISDSGIGMDKEILPTLFEQFRRDPSVAKKIQGTGLGLYISKEIVQAHGGEVWAESEGRGKGSTFSVRLKKA
jgi:signal transduction histidine kinase